MSASEGGGFRVRPEAASDYYRVAIDVAYREGASPDAIRRAINECHAEAIAECNRRFNRRPSATAGGNERRGH